MERLERFSLSSKSLGAKTPLQVHSEQELEAEKGSAKPTKGLARQERPNTSKGCVQTVFKNCLLCQDAKNHHARPCTKRHRLAGHSGPKNFCMKRALVGFARHAILIVVYGGSANSVCQASSTSKEHAQCLSWSAPLVLRWCKYDVTSWKLRLSAFAGLQ